MGFLFSKPTYDPKRDIPDLTGKVVVVTGSNTGIGYHTAEQLAIHGAKVYLACRTESKARDAIARIKKDNPALKGSENIVWLPLDLSSLQSAKKAAEQILAQETRLDILVNNAGRVPNDYELTKDGIEQSVCVNHIAHFVFTTTLLPLLKTTAALPGSDVRIVVLTSEAHRHAGQTKFESLEDFNATQGKPGKENGYITKFRRYGNTKLMNVFFAAELQRQLDEEKVPITVILVHPGAVATDGANDSSPWILRVYIAFAAITPPEGAYTSLFAATSAEVAAARDKYKAQYLVPFGKIEKLYGPATDTSLAKTLWQTTEKVSADILSRQ